MCAMMTEIQTFVGGQKRCPPKEGQQKKNEYGIWIPARYIFELLLFVHSMVCEIVRLTFISCKFITVFSHLLCKAQLHVHWNQGIQRQQQILKKQIIVFVQISNSFVQNCSHFSGFQMVRLLDIKTHLKSGPIENRPLLDHSKSGCKYVSN